MARATRHTYRIIHGLRRCDAFVRTVRTQPGTGRVADRNDRGAGYPVAGRLCLLLLLAFSTLIAVTGLSSGPAVAAAGSPLAARGAGALPSAGGDGWISDDTINAQVQDGTPSSVSASCTWRVVTGVDPVSGSFREGPVTRTVNGEHETLYQRTCPRSAGDSWYQWIPDSTKKRIADRAESRVTDRIVQLAFRTAPPRDGMVVNVGTWFWVPRVIWKPVQVTAYIETPVGVLSVTVRATPSRLGYGPGNGDDTVWCDGPGSPWTEQAGDAESSDCMYTYRHASAGHAGGRFGARTSVEWKVKVSSNFGLSFPLPSVRLGVGSRVTVREIQAVLG